MGLQTGECPVFYADLQDRSGQQCRYAGRPYLPSSFPHSMSLANVPIIIERVAAALAEADWEIIFVDDDFP